MFGETSILSRLSPTLKEGTQRVRGIGGGGVGRGRQFFDESVLLALGVAQMHEIFELVAWRNPSDKFYKFSRSHCCETLAFWVASFTVSLRR